MQNSIASNENGNYLVLMGMLFIGRVENSSFLGLIDDFRAVKVFTGTVKVFTGMVPVFAGTPKVFSGMDKVSFGMDKVFTGIVKVFTGTVPALA